MEIEFFSPLADALPALVWISLLDGRAEYVNRRWCEYTGLSLEQAIGFGWQSAIHPEDLALILQQWHLIVASGQPSQMEARLRRFDGEFRRFLFSAAPITDKSGRIIKWCGINTDIEDRLKSGQATRTRESEAELRQAHAQLTVAQRLSKTGSFTSDLLSDQHIWSDEFYRICEFEPGSKITVQKVRDIVHPEDLQSFDALIERGRAGHDVDFTFRIVASRGTLKHLVGAARVTEFIAGRPVFMGAVQDVTENKLAEAALKASETELRRAYDSFSDAQRLSKTGSFITDLLADDHNWSEEVFRIFEFDPATKVSVQRIREIVHPEDLQTFDSVIQRGAAGMNVDFVFRIVTASGAVKHIRGVAHVVERVSGRPMFIGALQDVTESKATEAALKASEAQLRRANQYLTGAQELSQTGSYTWEVTTDEQYLSDLMYRIWEFDPAKKVTHELVLSRIHPEDRPTFEAAQTAALKAGEDFKLAYRIVTDSGAVKHFRTVSRRLTEVTDRLVYIGATQDVTESKVAEEALNAARAELAHVARVMTLGALTASIAHEVNQPLSGIITNAGTCLRMLGTDPPNLEGARTTAQRTLRDGNRASEIIQRLRAMFAHKERTAERVDLNEAARDLVALSSSELQRSGVILRTDFDESLPAITGDRVQLQQVILNLVLNAADAMRTVDDRPRNLLVATARDGADRIRLFVRDSGVGIDPQNSEKLFEAFHTTKSHGMGVGLSISRSIIESHEGRIWATNNDGAGATFAFSIPAAQS
jgi:PAS domain S-box-containing protein